ncbi:aquaporin [Salinicoccus siamensis]|uniref:aquaporin n=1 Tax=Salinicoccus siamensis TaxID=381830 RepID=UPI003607EA5A
MAADWAVIAFGWGFAVTIRRLCHRKQISGGHINPAVTGFAVAGAFPWDQVIPYMIAQVLGGLLGGIIVLSAFHAALQSRRRRHDEIGFILYIPGRLPNYVANFASEIIGTFILVMGLLLHWSQ